MFALKTSEILAIFFSKKENARHVEIETWEFVGFYGRKQEIFSIHPLANLRISGLLDLNFVKF